MRRAPKPIFAPVINAAARPCLSEPVPKVLITPPAHATVDFRLPSVATSMPHQPAVADWKARKAARAAEPSPPLPSLLRGASLASLQQSSYERLLMLECCPERVGEQQASPLGKIEKIRIQW